MALSSLLCLILACFASGARIKASNKIQAASNAFSKGEAEEQWLWNQLAEKRDPNEPDSYIPSKMSLYASGPPATHHVADLEKDDAYWHFFPSQYKGAGKILVYATSKYLLNTSNGKFFNTGHHTSEFLLPLYHLMRAGFTNIDIATMDGGRVALEEWTFPLAAGYYEDKLRKTQADLKEKLENPMNIQEVNPDLHGYIAIFMPGGHGPVIEEHKDPTFGALLRKAHSKAMPLFAICHGPTALRSAALGGEFPFAGYKIAVFPDSMDDASPKFGYLPGYLKEEDKVEAHLKKLGMEVQNTEMDDMVVQDRELITGASQLAAQKFSKVAVQVLLSRMSAY